VRASLPRHAGARRRAIRSGAYGSDAARLKRPGLNVLFITGFAENAVVGNGQLEPGMHVLTKPFAMEALARRIKELLRK